MKYQNNPFINRATLVAASLAFGVGTTAHAIDYTWGGGNLDWSDTSASGWNGGPPSGGDNATINSGIVTLTTNNLVNPLNSITIGGTGKLTQTTGNTWSLFNNLTLSGGTLESVSIPTSTFGCYWLTGTVTVSGSSASAFATVGSGEQFINMGVAGSSTGSTTFNVADATSSPAADLVVSTKLGNEPLGGAAGLNKIGAGTMALTAANTYTGGTAVEAGTLQFASGSLDSTAYVGLVNSTLQWASGNTDALNKIFIFNGTTGTLDTNGNNVTLSEIQDNGANHTGSLEKTGAGVLTFTGTNSYTGSTTVTAGTLVVNGSISTSSLTTVAGAATLAGNGTVGAATINGTFAPGDGGIETLDISGNLTLTGGSFSLFEINTAGDISDLAIASAAIAFGGTLHVTNIGAPLFNGDMFDLFDWGTSASGTFGAVNLPGLTGGLAWDQSQLYTNGTITVVPEPAAALLGGLGMLALLRRRRA